jgi:deoxyribodipyrimidine photolyase-related protein
MTEISLVFPHQLFKNNPSLRPKQAVVIVEEWLFFRQYRFHRQKLIFHRASMKFYEDYLKKEGFDVLYIESDNELSDIRELIPWLAEKGYSEVHYCDPVDDWLMKRLASTAASSFINLKQYPSPGFIHSEDEIKGYYQGLKRFHQTDFYIHWRKNKKILLDARGKPVGGKWTFDDENRKPYPRGNQPPKVTFPAANSFWKDAVTYVQLNFNQNPGSLESPFRYPCTFEESQRWLTDFISERFYGFGTYEDALVQEEHLLHHSLLSPLLNVGLLTPDEVLHQILDGWENNIPLNSLEGFIRQLAGWREFIRAVYILKGSKERTTNFWGFTRQIPPAFYEGNTGIIPVDTVIEKVLKTGYAHHIERLMVLGNFMLLCEFDPDEVYRWFMEMFVDAYDWVMVPNVYGMSQFADGGLMSTKPYISGSNYLMKMGNYNPGQWQNIWDGLFWRFMSKHRGFFQQNPRLGMLIRTFDKMDTLRQQNHLTVAEDFIERLH